MMFKKTGWILREHGLTGPQVMALLLPIQLALAVKIRTTRSYCSACGVKSKVLESVWTSNGAKVR